MHRPHRPLDDDPAGGPHPLIRSAAGGDIDSCPADWAICSTVPGWPVVARPSDGNALVTDAPNSPAAELRRLVPAAQAGDRAALDQVLRLVHPIVLRGCRARMGCGHGHLDPEDVAQDVLCAIADGIGRFDPVRPFLGWVAAITGHKASDAFRRHYRDPSSPVDEVPEHVDSGDTPEPALLRSELADELRVLLAQLPEVHQSILVLRLIERVSAAETAEMLGMTAGSVRVAQHRALRRLRELVAGGASLPSG